MQRHGCRRGVFSFSANIYGWVKYLPCDEEHPAQPTNPYGRPKHFIEEIIRDWAAPVPDASAVLLRYFNPVGADAFGRLGEDPNNLFPYISQVAVGRLQHLNIFGADYDTRDGTGERDHIHVEDLARAHLAAIAFATGRTGCEAINVGTGHGAGSRQSIRAHNPLQDWPAALRRLKRLGRSWGVKLGLALMTCARRPGTGIPPTRAATE